MRRFLISIMLLVGCGPSYRALQDQVAGGADAFAVVDGSCDGYEDDEGCQRFIAKACAEGFRAQRERASEPLANGRLAAAVRILSAPPHRTCAPGTEGNADAIEEVEALQAITDESARAKHLAALGERSRASRLKDAELFTPLLDRSRADICGVHRATAASQRPERFAHDSDLAPWLAALDAASHWCPPQAQVEITQLESTSLSTKKGSARALLWRTAACARATASMPGLAATCSELATALGQRLPTIKRATEAAPAARVAIGATLSTTQVAPLDPALAEFARASAQARADSVRAERAALVIETSGPRATENIRAMVEERIRRSTKSLAALGIAAADGAHQATLRIGVPSAPRYRESKRVEYGTSRYLAGTRWVNNPDYYARNADCQREQGEYDDCLRRYDRAMRQYVDCRDEVNQKERRRAECMRRNEGYCASVNDHCAEPRQCDRRDAAQACEALARTPPQVEEEVWDDYRYPIEVVTVTYTGSADIDASLVRGTENSGRETAEIRVEATDRFIAGDPRRNVPDDPLNLPTDDALAHRFARRAARDALAQLAALHAQNCREPSVGTTPLDRIAERVRRQSWRCAAAPGQAADVDALLDGL